MANGPQKPAFTRWETPIRDTRVLTVFKGKSASGWSSAISIGVTRFNALSDALSFGMKLKEVTSSESKDSANVLVETADGKYTFVFRGGSRSGSLPSSGNKGVTEYGATADGIKRAFIFLPLRTQHTEFMKTCMVVHEFCHATGVHEHSSHVKPDIFNEHLVPSGDEVEAGIFNARKMPPIWMSYETAKKISDCWS